MFRQNYNNIFSVTLCSIICCINTVSVTLGKSINTTQNPVTIQITDTDDTKFDAMISTIPKENESTIQIPNLRFKRQSDGGKYSEASKMPQMKVFRLLLQMIRNLWATSYVGGGHPLHHEVPKPVIKLYKDKISTFFFPNVGEEQKVKS